MTLNEGPARRVQNTKNTRDEHSYPQCDSNPRPQKSSGFRRHALDRTAIGVGDSRI